MTLRAVWQVSLLRGPVPFAATTLGPISLAVLVALVRRRPRLLVAGTLATVAAVLGGAVLLAACGSSVSSYPRSFLVWAGLPILGLVTAPWLLPSQSWRARGATAVVLLGGALFAGSTINRHYAYVPTLGDAFGRPLPRQISLQAALGSLEPGDQAPTDVALPTDGLVDGKGAIAVASQGRATRATAGSVVRVTIPATTSGFRHRPEYVYLPPVWFDHHHPPLPVVLMLAGAPGGPGDWLRAGAAGVEADRWAGAHGGRAPILVFPDHNGSFTTDTECVDGPRGRAETYLSVDVPRYVQSVFGTDRDPAHWAVAGLSEGGTCALDLVLRHPDVFGHAVDLSGDTAANDGSRASSIRDLYGGDAAAYDAHDVVRLLQHPKLPPVTIWLGAGTHDTRGKAALAKVVDLARRAGLVVHGEVTAGTHNFSYWTTAWVTASATLFAALGTG